MPRAQRVIYDEGQSFRPRKPINAQGPPLPKPIYPEGPWSRSMAKAHLNRGPMEAHPCRELIHSEGPSGPSISRAQPCRESNHPEGILESIHAQGPFMLRAHPYPEPIHAEGSSLPWAHTSRGPMGAHPFQGPIHPEGPWGSIHTEGTSLLGAHPSRVLIGVHQCPDLIHAEVPSLPRAYPSRGPLGARHPC